MKKKKLCATSGTSLPLHFIVITIAHLGEIFGAISLPTVSFFILFMRLCVRKPHVEYSSTYIIFKAQLSFWSPIIYML